MDSLRVEVLPLLPHRWVAVVCGPSGEFATTSPSPEQVPADVEEAVRSLVGWAPAALEYVDERGDPWSPARAYAQAVRMDLVRRADRAAGQWGGRASDARHARPSSSWRPGR